jgi:hypothetical protein
VDFGIIIDIFANPEKEAYKEENKKNRNSSIATESGCGTKGPHWLANSGESQ